MQDEGRHHRPAPGTEIFGRKLLWGNAAEIFIHIRRTDALTRALFVKVLEQLITGQFLATLDETRQVAVVDRDIVIDAAFAAERETDLGAVHFNVDREFRVDCRKRNEGRWL